jgi:hypothetical protein
MDSDRRQADISVLSSDRPGRAEIVARMIHELSRRAQPKSRRSIARRCPTRCSNRKFSATKKAHSPARAIETGWLSWRTRDALSGRDRRHVAHRAGQTAARARERRFERLGGQSVSVLARSRRQTGRSNSSCATDDFAKTCITGSTPLPSAATLSERQVDIPVLAERSSRIARTGIRSTASRLREAIDML